MGPLVNIGASECLLVNLNVPDSNDYHDKILSFLGQGMFAWQSCNLAGSNW